MAQRPRVQAANLHDDTFGYPGAAQVARSSSAQIVEQQSGNVGWEQNHRSGPTQD